MRPVSPADVGYGGDGDARLEAAAHRMFWAAYLMATHSNGLSARQMWRQLGLGSYKSAWLLCAKLRRAMVDPARALLSGTVEIDETQVSYCTKDDPAAGGGGGSPDGKR